MYTLLYLHDQQFVCGIHPLQQQQPIKTDSVHLRHVTQRTTCFRTGREIAFFCPSDLTTSLK